MQLVYIVSAWFAGYYSTSPWQVLLFVFFLFIFNMLWDYFLKLWKMNDGVFDSNGKRI